MAVEHAEEARAVLAAVGHEVRVLMVRAPTLHLRGRATPAGAAAALHADQLHRGRADLPHFALAEAGGSLRGLESRAAARCSAAAFLVSGAVAVQPSAAPARGRSQLLLRLNRASRQSPCALDKYVGMD